MTVWSDYKEIDGLQLAHKITNFIKGGEDKEYKLVGGRVVTEAQVLDKLPDDVFSLPKPKKKGSSD